jgi:hypothetical protein
MKHNMFASERKGRGRGGLEGFASCQEVETRNEKGKYSACATKIKRIREKNDWREENANKNLYKLARQPGEVCQRGCRSRR